MQLFVITSTYSDIPLAEIRTDSKVMEFVVDNTNGKLPSFLGNDYQKLLKIIQKSHHLKLSHPKEMTVGLLRYTLENGDIVETTTDGKTALLNGSLLNEQEKSALFYAISNGHLKVKQKADLNKPIPVLPKIEVSDKKEQDEKNKDFFESLKKVREKTQHDNSFDSSSYDHKIEGMDFSYAHNPAMIKDLMYMLKYGNHKGGGNA